MPGVHVVTGAFSFTGAHVARALLERGERVRTLSRRPALIAAGVVTVVADAVR